MAPTCIAETKKLTKKPLLRKDFIIDEYQVYESRLYGADAILLIAAILTKEKINKFIKIAKTYNMDCLVEVHTKEELEKVLKTSTNIIGINNRNLKTFKIDINTTLKLKKLIPKTKLIVSESGFKTKADIKKLKNINAVLIGTTFMKAKNINKKIGELLK
jgi:indole-3-glycerol phosphate synthase